MDRSAEALEHLNKIIKSITKRGLKRYTTVEKEKAQKEKALQEGRSFQGIHLGYKGSRTSRFVMVESTARKFYDANWATRESYWARSKYKKGRGQKELAALDLADAKARSAPRLTGLPGWCRRLW